MQKGGSRGAAARRSFLAATWKARLRLLREELATMPRRTPEERAARSRYNVERLREMAALQRALRRRVRLEAMG